MIIWVSSYPKSGNTWVRTFISTYYLSKTDKFNFSMLKNIRQFPHEKFFDKKLNSSNTFKIIEIQQNTNVTIPKDLKKEVIKFF